MINRIKDLEARLADLDSRNNYPKYAAEIRKIEAELRKYYDTIPEMNDVPF